MLFFALLFIILTIASGFVSFIENDKSMRNFTTFSAIVSLIFLFCHLVFPDTKTYEHLVCYDQSDRNMIIFDSGIGQIRFLKDGRWMIRNDEILYYTQIPGTICTVMTAEAPQGVEK